MIDLFDIKQFKNILKNVLLFFVTNKKPRLSAVFY